MESTFSFVFLRVLLVLQVPSVPRVPLARQEAWALQVLELLGLQVAAAVQWDDCNKGI